MGATYGFAKSAAANLREKEDPWNPAIAGFLAGAVGGLKCELTLVMLGDAMATNIFADRTLPAVLGFGTGLAVVQGVFQLAGGNFSGFGMDPQMDEYGRKEELKALRRRPVQETLEQLGERSSTEFFSSRLAATNMNASHARTELERTTSR